jgi:predicted transposase/invertase (TIGR01784 family)
MKHKILSPMLDFIFKDIFGDERRIDILIAFLKEALRLPPEEYEGLTVVDPHLKREHPDDKLCVLDVKVKTTSGRVINVEVQISTFEKLIKRFTLNSAKLLTEQIKIGEDYNVIEPAVSIIIVKDTLVPNDKSYYNTYRIANIKTGVELTNILEINILELSKLPREPDGTGLYKWAEFFKSESEEEFAMVAEQDPAIKKAVARVMELSDDEANQMIAWEKWKFQFDYHAGLRAREEAKTEGYNEGYNEAKAEEQEQIRQEQERNRQLEEEIRRLRNQ